MTSTGRFHLSPERQALLESLLRAEGIERAEKAGPQRRTDPAAPVPLTFAQHRFWFLDQLSANGASYVISAGLRLSGDVRFPELAESCRDIARRHEALRTVFHETEGQPMQQVLPELPPEVRTVELRGFAPRDVLAELRRREAELIARPFDLAHGPLFRVELLDLADGEAAVLVNVHHIVSDRWSMDVLMRELMEIYRARVDGRAPRLPELTIQYPDFALWQQRPEARDSWEEELNHWTRALRELPAETGLPTPLPRPREKTYRGSSVPVELPADLLARLRELARAEGATLFMGLTAVFKVLLARLSGSTDIVVGTPVANRTRVELEPLVGLFVNTLALRTELSGDPSFREALNRVAATCHDAYAHQDVPFERLVEQLQPNRSLSHTPVFQVLVSYQNVSMPSWDGPLRFEAVPLQAHKAEFDLLLDMFQDGERVWGRLEYSTDLYDQRAAERLVRLFTALLRAAVADPGAPVSRLELLTAAERLRLLAAEPEAAPVERPDAGWFHQRVEEQARRRPDAEAVRCGDRHLSYGELNLRANQLAHHLIRLGVGPDVVVGVCLDPSPELPVALLAVAKAGGVFAPIVPRQPAARMDALLRESAAPMLLTERPLLDGLPPVGADLLLLDELAPVLARESAADPVTEVAGTDLAHVRYTAAAGGPVGVVTSHAALRARLLSLGDALPLGPADRVLHSAPLVGDFAAWEILWPLTTGAVLVLARLDGDTATGLAETVRVDDVTTLRCAPPLLAGLLADATAVFPTGLRRVITDGELLPASLRDRFLARSGAELHQLYGTAETGPVVLWSCGPEDGPGPVPLGRPIAGIRAVLLDRDLRPVPPGEPGELHLAGPQLASGYLDRPELTARRFTDDPTLEPTARYFRTGDLVRRRADGALELLGRVDQPVRVRGYRADPARAESALWAHPRVLQAVVVARQDPEGSRLVAYVTGPAPLGPDAPGPSATGLDPAELADHVRGLLPDHEVPADFVVLPKLPLTPAGTVDRAALPVPEGSGAGAARPAIVAPRNDLERSVAELWCELLGLSRVSVHDDFFELGGHSLLLTKLASRLSAAYGVTVPLRELFEHHTVARMAAFVGARKSAGQNAETPIPAVDRERELPLSFAQEELCLHHPRGPEDSVHNTTTSVRLTGPLDAGALRRSLNAIVARHEVLRTRVVVRSDGPPVQEVTDDATWPLIETDLRTHAPADRESALRDLLKAERGRGFRISEEPLVRGRLVRTNAEEYVLVQVMHHLVTDNWSYGVLVSELSELYAAETAGRPPRLPELAVQFPDVAAWQQRRLAEGGFATDLAYWRDRLAGSPPALRLAAPTVGTGEAVTGATRGFVLGAPTAEALAELGRKEDATLFMVLLAAYQVLLSAFSGSDDVTVDFPVAGRERPETEHLIGYFVNHLLVRSDLASAPTFGDLLAQVRTHTLAAYAHQGAPLWALDEEHAPGPELTGITFNLLNAVLPELDLPGLGVAPLERGAGDDYVFSEVTADFERSAVDLALIMRQDENGELRGMWLYSLDRMDADALGEMMRQWPCLLALVTSGADLDLGELRRRLLAEHDDPAPSAQPVSGER